MAHLRALLLLFICACSRPILVASPGAGASDAEPDAGAALPDVATERADAAALGDDGGTSWLNPGCARPANVVDTGLELELEVDLSRQAAREYAVRERVTVHPRAPGDAITLFGAALILGEASAGYSYDGVRATFCTDPFEAGEAVTIEVTYVVSEAFQRFPAGSLAGIRVWQEPGGPPVIGPFSSPYFASTWVMVPQTMFWFDSSHDGNVAVDRVALTVVTPDPSWTVIGPGDASRDGLRWTFEIDRTMPLYTLSFAASPAYERVELGAAANVSVSAAVLPRSLGAAELRLATVGRALEWMVEHVGAFPWREPLTVAEIPELSGGMEHTAGIWLGSPVMDRAADGDYVAVHETVHHWWGNDVRIADWPDLWLNEGLVEWTTVFAVLEAIGGNAGNAELQRRYRTEAAEMSYPIDGAHPLPGPLRFSPDGDVMGQVSNNLLFFYRYGAAFLEMVDLRLRSRGDDLVAALRDWHAATTGTAVTTDQLRELLITRSGDRAEWTRLFEAWVDQGPCPTLELGAFTYANGVAEVELRRTGGAGQDLSAVEVAFIAGGVPHTTEVSVPSTGHAVASVAIPSAPSAIAIDPDGFYILRLRAAPGWTGPTFANALP